MDIKILPSLLKNNKTIKIHGHKHSFVQIISAALVLNQECYITNVPVVDDVLIFEKLINQLGGKAEFKNNKFYFNPNNINFYKIDKNLCKKIHGSFYFLFALTLRFHKLEVIKTGGCQIGENGSRPDDHIIDILKKFGKIKKSNNYEYSFQPTSHHKIIQDIFEFSDDNKVLSGEKISSATKLTILAAINELSETVIKNYYFRTDVSDLLKFIQLCGISIHKNPLKIKIAKNSKKTKPIIEFELSDCQSEVFTYITMAIINNTKLTLLVKDGKNLKKILKYELKKLKEMGINLTITPGVIKIPKVKIIHSKNIIIKHKTIQSDHHPFFTLLLLHSDKPSYLIENVWKNRFGYIEELKKIGARINKNGSKITIKPSVLESFDKNIVFDGLDTRTSALLTIAAIKLNRPVTIKNIEHLSRGYDGFIENLNILGASILL